VIVLISLTGLSLSQSPSSEVTVTGDIAMTGSLRTANLRSNSLLIDGGISVARGIVADSITTLKADVTVLQTTEISNPNGVVVIASPTTSGAISAQSLKAVSFIQNDVHQWAMVHHEDFEAQIKGWSAHEVSSCDGVDHHLGGHCKEVGGEVTKTFSGLPPHTHIRVQARYHFLDSWEGESAFAKVDNRIVWTEVNDMRGLDLPSFCGGDHPDGKFSVPVDVTLKHSAESIVVAFGSTLDEHPCNESFGIDDVMISVR